MIPAGFPSHGKLKISKLMKVGVKSNVYSKYVFSCITLIALLIAVRKNDKEINSLINGNPAFKKH